MLYFQQGYNKLLNNMRVEQRIIRHLHEIQFDSPPNIAAGPISNDLLHWQATIIGPEDTPYSGGVFKLNLTFSQDFPFRPPKFKFITKIFHPNINDNGQICLNILSDQSTPALTISNVLLSIQSILSEPYPEYYQWQPKQNKQYLSSQSAMMYRRDRERFYATAKQWTIKYAQ